MTSSQLRIAWFSDLSIGRPESLSTYCTRLLVPELSKTHTIEVFSDEATLVESGLFCGVRLDHALNAYKRHRECPFDLFFYQLEDSKACRFIRGHIGLIPGVVWVHDLFCNDLGPEACHTSPWEQTIKQFYDSSLEFVDRSKAPHQLWPRAFRETSLCPVVLFSSRWARNEFKRMLSNRLESAEGMHRADVLPVPVCEVQTTPKSKHDIFRIATLAVPGIEGRSHKVLPVLRDLNTEWHLSWMVDSYEVRAVDALLAEFGIPRDRVTVVSPRSVERWSEVLTENDVALHLHTGPFGHLAPFIQMSMAHSQPVIVDRSAQGEDFPENAVFHVTPGLHESTELKCIFRELLTAREGGRSSHEFGHCGARLIKERSDVLQIAQRLTGILIESAPHVSYVMSRWHAISRKAQKVLLREVEELVSYGKGDVVSAYERVLMPAIKDLGW